MKMRMLLSLGASLIVAFPLAYYAVGQGNSTTRPSDAHAKPTVRIVQPEDPNKKPLDEAVVDNLNEIQLRNAVTELASRVRDLEARVQSLENPRVRVIPVR